MPSPPRHSALRPSGTVCITTPDGGETQHDTLQCAHCGRHWVVLPGSGRVRGFCLKCMKPTCGAPECDACDPVEAKLQRLEQQYEAAKQLAGGALVPSRAILIPGHGTRNGEPKR